MKITEEQKLNDFGGLSRLYKCGLIKTFPKLIYNGNVFNYTNYNKYCTYGLSFLLKTKENNYVNIHIYYKDGKIIDFNYRYEPI